MTPHDNVYRHETKPMKLEQQVVSLELGKRLKELGVNQEILPGESYWVKTTSGWHFFFLNEQEDPPSQTPFEWCKAYSVAELGDMLPAFLDGHYLCACKEPQGWQVYYTPASGANDMWGGVYYESEIEADARAKMLAYLIENKLITLP